MSRSRAEGRTAARGPGDSDHGSTAGADPCVLWAPAKLTLSLRITGTRADGYHTLDAEMVTVDLADRLEFSSGSELTVTSQAVGGLDVPADGTNLVTRALQLVDRSASVHLEKRIPAGAGLGGGSADAAAVLRWAGVDDPALAARLGADVPFCLAGGRARVTGVGDELSPLPLAPLLGQAYTLVTPPFGVSTVAAYRAWDDLGGPHAADGGNDLEAAALAVEPRLARWRDELTAATGQPARLAGSGSTWFVEGDFPGPGRVVARVCAIEPEPVVGKS